MANEAVDEEVDTGVENAHGMRDMGQAPDPSRGEEVFIWISFLQVYAHDDVVEVRKLPHVNDDTRGVTATKGDDDAKKDDEKIQLGSPSGIRSKTLNLDCANIYNDSKVKKHHEDERNNCSEEHPEVDDIILHILRISSQWSHMISGNPLWDVQHSHIAHLHFQIFNGISFIIPGHF